MFMTKRKHEEAMRRQAEAYADSLHRLAQSQDKRLAAVVHLYKEILNAKKE